MGIVNKIMSNNNENEFYEKIFQDVNEVAMK